MIAIAPPSSAPTNAPKPRDSIAIAPTHTLSAKKIALNIYSALRTLSMMSVSKRRKGPHVR